jgi:opacity protein-like surface antigen
MTVNKLFSAIILSFVSFSATVEASPYLSAQVGTFGAGDIDGTLHEGGELTRIAAGYSWNTTKKIRLGLESAFTFFKETKISITYEPFSTWYNTREAYNIDGSSQRLNFDLLGVFDFYATKKFDLFVKAGKGYQKRKFKSESTNPAFSSATSNASGFKMGLGLGYDIIKNLNLNLEFAYQGGENSYFVNKATPSFGTTMLGLRYKIAK